MNVTIMEGNAQNGVSAGKDSTLNKQPDCDDDVDEYERQEAELLEAIEAEKKEDPEKRAALRKARQVEWSEKLLGKRYVTKPSTEIDVSCSSMLVLVS
ncbi:MAG: hypothetical protein Q9191_001897 [Dirinaria sp. TL-2023a]